MTRNRRSANPAANRRGGEGARAGATTGLSSLQKLAASSHKFSFLSTQQGSSNPKLVAAYNQGDIEEMRKVYCSGADRFTARPPPKLNITIHVALPEPLRGFKYLDPSDVDIQAVFLRIATEHEARVEPEEDGSSITIKATNRARARDVLMALRKHLLYRPGEESVWRPQVLIHPPSEGKNCFRAILQPKEGDVGVRPTAATTKGLKFVDQDDVATAVDEYKTALRKTLERTGSVLRNNPNGMRMRAQFGNVVLIEWNKGKTEYTFSEISRLVNRTGSRGTVRMVNGVSKSAVDSLRKELFAANGALPPSVKTFLDPEAEPVFSLVLQTKNLDVESTLEPVQAQGNLSERTTQLHQFTLGPLVAHQQDRRQRTAEIVTLCPESPYDWELEIRKLATEPEAVASPPFSVRDLGKHIQFARDPRGGGFPRINISNDLIRRHEIQKVYGKETWTYMLSMRYNLEITLYHAWNKNGSAPVVTASVALYSSEWDDDMLSGASVPRQWDASFSKQFLQPYESDEAPGNNNTGDGLDHFLSWVHWIQKALGKSSEHASGASDLDV